MPQYEQWNSTVLAVVQLLSFLKNHYANSCNAFSVQLAHGGMHIGKKWKNSEVAHLPVLLPSMRILGNMFLFSKSALKITLCYMF
jgi:hypothetical protein